jgi:hypothetical protein
MGSIDAALRAGRKLDMAAATSVTATLANVMGSFGATSKRSVLTSRVSTRAPTIPVPTPSPASSSPCASTMRITFKGCAPQRHANSDLPRALTHRESHDSANPRRRNQQSQSCEDRQKAGRHAGRSHRLGARACSRVSACVTATCESRSCTPRVTASVMVVGPATVRTINADGFGALPVWVVKFRRGRPVEPELVDVAYDSDDLQPGAPLETFFLMGSSCGQN